MAASSLLALLDDIATVLDDVAILTKIAAKKTAGVLGDDLALNAEQVSGVRAERELPVVWAVAKGSFKNKFILAPAALIISVIAPWLVMPLLMIGGGYLCFEGFEKVFHHLFHSGEKNKQARLEKLKALMDETINLVKLEKEKIKGAIRTDFVLSAEIIVIALGTVKDETFLLQATVVASIAILMTVGVYGLVAAIVKLDDLGFHLVKEEKFNAQQKLGEIILWFAPYLMKTLSVVGTAAMFLVGGSILLHGTPHSQELIHNIEIWAQSLPFIGNTANFVTSIVLNGLMGIFSGGLISSSLILTNKLRNKIKN